MATLCCPTCKALVTRASTSTLKGPRRHVLHEFRETRWAPGEGVSPVLSVVDDFGKMEVGYGAIGHGDSVGYAVHPHQPRLP